MLPDAYRKPTVSGEFHVSLTIAASIGLDLGLPQVSVRLGPRRVFLATVPEAPVNEHRNSRAEEHDVRLPSQRRNGPDVDTEAEAVLVQRGSESSFRCCVSPRLALHSIADAR